MPNNQLFLSRPHLDANFSDNCSFDQPLSTLGLKDAPQVLSATVFDELVSSAEFLTCRDTDFSVRKDNGDSNPSLLNPLGDSFEFDINAGSDTSIFSSSITGNLTPSAPIFVPVVPQEMLSEGNCILQSPIYIDESEDVLNMTPCVREDNGDSNPGLLNPLEDSFESDINAGSDKSILSSSITGNLTPSAPIFVPVSPLEMLSEGNCILQSPIHIDESEDVLNMTPCVFDTETPDLSMHDDDSLTSNTTTVSPFLTMSEFGAYAFIYMISLMIIGIFSRSYTSVSSLKPSSIGGSLAMGNGGDTSTNIDARSIINIDNNENDDPKSLFHNLKAKNSDRPVIAHININFLNPKFEPLKDMIKDNVDILLVSETKLDDTFPDGQFFIEGYKEPIRLDRNRNGGGLLCFIHDDLDCKEIKSHKLTKKTEGIFIKLNIRNTKWLIMGGYNPDKKNIENFLECIGKELDRFLPQYENLLLLGDFNSEMCEEHMENFCETYNLTNLITDPTCFKSLENPSCIDVMLTNRSACFENFYDC